MSVCQVSGGAPGISLLARNMWVKGYTLVWYALTFLSFLYIFFVVNSPNFFLVCPCHVFMSVISLFCPFVAFPTLLDLL